MLEYIYSVYDRKAQYYLPIFTRRSDADAQRQFAEIVATSDTPISKYPADFDLVRLGTIDLETGSIEPEHPMGLLINGLVSLQALNAERKRYSQSLGEQVDIETFIAEQS
nr:MAG: nonstructural protein [Microvirus sp.]